MTSSLSLTSSVVAAACLAALSPDAAVTERPDSRPRGRPGVGDLAPPLELETLDGAPRGQPKGALTVIDFFATWCKPCHEGLRDLAAIQKADGADLQFLVVDVGEDPVLVRRFLAGAPLHLDARVLLDPSGATARAWGQDRFPTTFLVDRAGVIRHINRGWGPGYRERLGRWLRAMHAAAAE